MKKLILRATLGAAMGATLAAAALTPAFAFGPSRSDAHPPGALFQSSPSGAGKDDPRGGMLNPPDDLRMHSAMRASNIRLNTWPLHRGVRHHRSMR